MKYQFFGMILMLAIAGFAHAQSDVFLCVDANGNKEYKNTGTTKGCKRVEMPGITVFSTPVRKGPVAQTASAKPASSPSDFPKVDNGTQKARDSDRKQILLEEMKAEENKLAGLKKELGANNEPERRGDERNYAKYQERVGLMKEDVGRTEKNIDALKREIGNIK